MLGEFDSWGNSILGEFDTGGIRFLGELDAEGIQCLDMAEFNSGGIRCGGIRFRGIECLSRLFKSSYFATKPLSDPIISPTSVALYKINKSYENKHQRPIQ